MTTDERDRLRELADRQARTLEALRASEGRFRALADSAASPIITIDESDVIRFANPATGTTFGYPLEEIVGRHLTDLMPERFRDRHRRGMTNFARTGERRIPWTGVQLVGLHSSGREIPLWISFGSFEQRGERYFTGIVLDLTERQAAEEALRSSEAHYRRLVETSPYAIYVLNQGGQFTEVNAAAEAILGRSSDELLGRHFAEVIAPEAREQVVDVFNDLVDGTTDRIELDIPVLRPSGEQRVLRVAAARIEIAGDSAGVHGIASDVTEARAREAQRRMLAAALDRLPDAVALATLDGDFLYLNQAHSELLGYAPEARPASIRELVADEEAGDQLDEILATLRGSGRWSGRVRRRRADGAELTVAVLAAIVPVDPPFLFIVMRDAREEITREEHVRRVERLASLGTLIGGVAHELNNPLTAIVGFTHLMLADERSEEDIETLRIVAREAERAARIVSDLRLLARNTQEQKPRGDAVDMNDVVRHVVKVRDYSLRTRNIEVMERLGDELPKVRGNRAELEQVVLNLVVNAEQALARVDDRPRRLVLRTRVSPAGVVLHVIDNGPGIPRELLQRIFDPFFTTKSPGEGTGLGLSLVHSIVEEHGGHLRVASEPGNGAEFAVELVAIDAGQLEPAFAAAPPSAPWRPSLRVLVVEDEPAVRRLINRVLSARGHTVEEAVEGAAALEILERRADEFDVVVSDIRMPGLDGDELIARLRIRHPRLADRVLLVTGDPGSAGSGGSLPGEVMMKPFDLEEFARRVEGLTESER